TRECWAETKTFIQSVDWTKPRGDERTVNRQDHAAKDVGQAHSAAFNLDRGLFKSRIAPRSGARSQHRVAQRTLCPIAGRQCTLKGCQSRSRRAGSSGTLSGCKSSLRLVPWVRFATHG